MFISYLLLVIKNFEYSYLIKILNVKKKLTDSRQFKIS
jgi:hypothetical protein